MGRISLSPCFHRIFFLLLRISLISYRAKFSWSSLLSLLYFSSFLHPQSWAGLDRPICATRQQPCRHDPSIDRSIDVFASSQKKSLCIFSKKKLISFLSRVATLLQILNPSSHLIFNCLLLTVLYFVVCFRAIHKSCRARRDLFQLDKPHLFSDRKSVV